MSSEDRACMELQAWTLRSLLEQLERQEAEDEASSISGEFLRLKNQSTKYRADKTFPTKSAENQENIKKNRYKDIVPYDHSRVPLSLRTSSHDGDYINASFIQGVGGPRAYIATQGPLPHTLVDFFRMIWEFNIQVVVMACREFEMGKKKCERYWPLPEEPPFVCQAFSVCCESEEHKGDYLTRTLEVTFNSCSRTLKQLHYVHWPDHGIPDSIPPILEMLAEMRFYQPHDDVPICIHCSAGCGRTGVLCAIDFTWTLLKNRMIPSDFNIYNLVHQMRTQRQSLVQTKEQYKLVYGAIRLLFTRFLRQMEEEQTDPAPPVLQAKHGPPEWMDDLREDEEDAPQQHLSSSSDGDDVIASPEWQQQHATHSHLEAEASGLTVEDPYFEAFEEVGRWEGEVPLIHLEEQTEQHCSSSTVSGDEDDPPPLPERTPESYLLAAPEGDAAPGPLSLIVPPGEVTAGGPPSPVPPLPERTPESFVLAVDPDQPQQESVTPYVNLDRLGLSSEWSGTSSPAAHRPERDSWSRSKSLRTKAPSHAPALRPILAPPLPPPTQPESLTPPLPEQTSFILQTENGEFWNVKTVCFWFGVSRLVQVLQNSGRLSVGRSRSLTPRGTTRIRAGSSWTSSSPAAKPFEPKVPDLCPRFSQQSTARVSGVQLSSGSALPPHIPGPIKAPFYPPAASAASERSLSSSLNTVAGDSTADRSEEKTFSRSRSLRLFRSKNKQKASGPAAAQTPTRPFLSSGFKLGFGIRIGKPKGPRNYPDSWF
ncbi:tyrosine-protein phosphatase non-receptor type 22 isoform X2 [Synchiropus splendidus]|uniref:tyrosine-protein phosphatase non-receptor type 22 isoform X2 n=1 Tax=Synchiropus splendidus TaxID=270530 RepID=UPI00237DF26A|nr:tyrosine-protein phosphatase non-receptor type 22 isoform X2 [Synchiropus splendidus]